LGEFSLWSTCTRVQEGLAAAWCGQWCCRGAKEAPGVVRLLCSDTLSVRLCWLGPAFTRCTFWRLLGGEGSRLKGLTCGPKSPRAPEASGGVCLLMSRPMRDPVGGVVDSTTPAGQRWGALQALGARGACLWFGPWLALEVKGGQGLGPNSC
jgi:hypothetical protein